MTTKTGRKQTARPRTLLGENGEALTRGVRKVTFTYKGHSLTVDMPGYYAKGEGTDEGVHVGADLEVSDRALRELKRRAEGIPGPQQIRAIRERLGLSQRAAGQVLGIGANAFAKYETDRDIPSGPTRQLLRLLEKHPELVEELQES